jgi:hypothetical protein
MPAPIFTCLRKPVKSIFGCMITALLAISGLIEPHAVATSIVILSNSKEIWVAADSKATPGPAACKIFKIGSMYWAMSGLTSNTVTKYDVGKIVKQSYGSGRTVGEMLRVFEKNAETPLQKTMILDHQYSKSFNMVRYHPLEIAFWRFEGGKPVIASVYYTTVVIHNKVSLIREAENITDCTIVDCSRRTDATMLGVRGGMVNYLQSHKDWATSGDLGKMAYFLVQLAIKEAPNTVGYPINVLNIQPDGSHKWDAPNECCHGEPNDPKW